MIKEEIKIRTSEGSCDGIIFRPENEKRLPAIIHLTDIRGIRPATEEMALRVAQKGYCVLLPNIFYRTTQLPVFDFEFNMKEERTQKRFQELTHPLTPEAIEQDAKDLVHFLASREYVSESSMGVVGYCFSGSMALRIAAARPDRIAAAASFHGGRLYTDLPESPHLLLPKIKANLYFGYAIEDSSMSEDAIGKFTHALEQFGSKYNGEVYQDARHGWTVSDSPAFNKNQADRAFQKLINLLDQTLK